MLSGLKISSLNSWLHKDLSENSDKQYRHSLIRENKKDDVRESVVEELKPVIQKVHDDARFKLREFLRDTLDPLEEWDDEIDPAEGYPEVLDLTTLKGYFGEIFSGIIAENFSPFDEKNWRVPVFPFRFHNTAFDQLEMYHQTGQMKKATYGRTGDDCVAFVLDGDTIVKILFLEAKCTAKYDMSMIADAHTKISSANQKPVELMRLVQILKSYRQDSEADVWITALRKLYRSKDGFERFDCVSYVCGQFPKRPKEKVSWISRENPHPNYIGGRKLEAIEIQLTEVNDIVRQLYGKED
ncbi:Uncharacterised protein [Mycobacteroides abscessus subsp. abscessus]|nr:Uncharacterised protein [Mycobacteroides abscessus subsp. abscessus]